MRTANRARAVAPSPPFWISAVLVACAAPAAGCVVSTDLGGTSFLCTDEPLCPEGYTCVDGRCVEGAGLPDGGGGAAGDAGGRGDALAPDAGGERFRFRQRLSFDNLARGELVDVPVLVALDARRIDYGAVRPDGADIQFRDPDDTALAHEVERWDPLGASILWVRVPVIDAASDGDFIWMYYGDPDAAVPEDAASVWRTYESVYHLGDGGGTIADSSARAYDGTSVGAEPVEGFVGGGRGFDGVSQYVDLGNDRDFARAAPGLTVEAWMNPSAAQQGVAFGASGNGAPASRVELRFELATTLRGGARTDEASSLQTATSAETIPLDTWSWVALVCDFSNDRVSIYIDGSLVTRVGSLLFDPTTDDTTSDQASIGVNETFASDFFAGLLDEVRLAPAVLDADWLSAQNASMRDQLIAYSGPESL